MLIRRLKRILFAMCCLGIVLCIGLDNDFFAIQSVTQLRQRFGVVINEVMPLNRGLIQAGDGGFYGCIELYNASDIAVDLEGFGLSADPQEPFRWIFPAMRIEPHGYVTVWTSGKDAPIDEKSAHANFKLSANDNVAVLTSPDREWRTALLFGHMHENISYGRLPDGSDALYWFDGCTAGGSNDSEPLGEGKQGQRLGAPTFSLPAGFYEGDTVLELSCENGSEIRYTLDGSEPQKDDAKSVGPLLLTNRAEPYVIRARSFQSGYPKSSTVTRTYFVDEGISDRYDIPVVSLSTSPANLFNYETGIYVPGKVRDDWLLAHPETAGSLGLPANYNQAGKRWERPAYLELFEPGGKLCISQGIGVRTHGGYSLDQPNKSLSLLADADYDARDLFEYDFFSEGSDNYLPLNGVILRNSATDAQYSLFRDAFMQSLADPQRLDLQASRPCIAFINGEYYGIYNIRPLYSADYLARKYGFDAEDAVIIKNPTGGIGDDVQEGFAGDEFPYSALFTFIKRVDMRKPENYAYVKTQIDIENYIEYNILEIYCGNNDWLANNVRIWRKRTQAYEPLAPYGQDGRWRWLVYDLDAGYGLFYISYEENSLAKATATGSEEWYNTDEFTVMLRALLTNEEFKTSFITRFSDLLNTSFSAENAQARLDAMLEIYLPYVPQQILRWKLHNGSMDSYLSEIDRMRAYAQNRPDVIRGHIKEYFKLSGINRLEVSVSGEGSVRLNTLLLGAENLPFTGFYFPGIPVMMEAIPAQGYRFVGWEGSIVSENETLAVNLTSPAKLRAVFVPASQQEGGPGF